MPYTISTDGKAITCGVCGLTSHNPTDVAQLYCVRCHKFHRRNDRGPYALIADKDDPWTTEFDCPDCGRHIIALGNPVLLAAYGGLCAACFSIPRWYLDAELANAIDPGYTRDPAGVRH